MRELKNKKKMICFVRLLDSFSKPGAYITCNAT